MSDFGQTYFASRRAGLQTAARRLQSRVAFVEGRAFEFAFCVVWLLAQAAAKAAAAKAARQSLKCLMCKSPAAL